MVARDEIGNRDREPVPPIPAAHRRVAGAQAAASSSSGSCDRASRRPVANSARVLRRRYIAESADCSGNRVSAVCICLRGDVFSSATAPRKIGAICVTGASIRRKLRLHNGFAAVRKARFGERHHLDHQLIGGAGIIGEGENPVAQKDRAPDLRIGIEDRGHAFCQRKARNGVGHTGHPVAEHFARDRLRLPADRSAPAPRSNGCDRQFVRQKRMQQRFNGRIGRG